MKMPWQERTGLSKFAAIFGCLLGISTGLCGANVLLISATTNDAASGVLIVTAYLELAGMIAGAGGLLIVALVWMVREFLEIFRR